jgi:phosphoesterase RecJ-like protein
MVLDFSVLKNILSQRKKIAIVSHTNPDGDSIGSSLALYHFLKAYGHLPEVVVPNEYPGFLAWMPGEENILLCTRDKEQGRKALSEAEIIFCLDHNAPSRTGEMEEAFKNAGGLKIMIDHHVNPDLSAYDMTFSTTETSSTSELVFDMMSELNPGLIDKTISECIYVGIMTDTGSFSYSCNSEKTFRTVAELYKNGIDGVKIHKLVYDTFSESRLRLLGYCLSEKLVVLPEYHTAYIWLTRKELNRFNFKTGDTEGVVNYALGIKGIKFAALFTEKENKIRISFRSTGNFEANVFARTHFEGGGHKNAAGGDSFIPMKETLKKFEQLLIEYKDKLSG